MLDEITLLSHQWSFIDMSIQWMEWIDARRSLVDRNVDQQCWSTHHHVTNSSWWWSMIIHHHWLMMIDHWKIFIQRSIIIDDWSLMMYDHWWYDVWSLMYVIGPFFDLKVAKFCPKFGKNLAKIGQKSGKKWPILSRMGELLKGSFFGRFCPDFDLPGGSLGALKNGVFEHVYSIWKLVGGAPPLPLPPCYLWLW